MSAKVAAAAVILVLCAKSSLGQIAGLPLYDAISQTAGLGQFASLMAQAGLQHLLNDPATFTVFAWNDTVWRALPYPRRNEILNMPNTNPVKFIRFMKFHILYGTRLDVQNIQNEDTRNTMAGRPMYFNRVDRHVESNVGSSRVVEYYVNGAMIWKAGTLAQNGIFHILDQVIEMTSEQSVYGYIGTPDSPRVHSKKFFDLITKYLSGEEYGIIMDLSMPDKKVTFLVPSDKAMSKIPQVNLQQLQGNSKELGRVVKRHVIPDRVVFTSYIYHNQGFPGKDDGRQITFRKPYTDKVYVNSDGVSAEVVVGNITCSNGVMHVVDSVLGFVYYTAQQQIEAEARDFSDLFGQASDDIRNSMIQGNGLQVFVPLNEAFNYLRNLNFPPWNSWKTNRTIVDMVLEYSILQPDQQIDIAALQGSYMTRRFLISRYEGQTVAVYNERNQTWAQAGGVKARVITPDIRTKNGKIHFIDGIFGIPTMDIPTLIYYDDWLLRTDNVLRNTRLKTWLKDPRYNPDPSNLPPRSVNSFGQPTDPYGNSYVTQYPNQYTTRWNPNQYPNQYTTRYPGQIVDQNQNQNQNPTIQDWDPCGSITNVCEFTFFVPNGTAIDHFQNNQDIGWKIMNDPPRFRYVLSRHIFKQKVYLDKMPSQTSKRLRAVSGDDVILTKRDEHYAELSFGVMTTRVIQGDLGATNGVVHIVTDILAVREDMYRTIDGNQNTASIITLLLSVGFAIVAMLLY